MNLSFAGCGFLGIYHVGVAVCFKKYAPHLLLNRISGASAGAIAACCLLCDAQIGDVASDMLGLIREARLRTLGPFSPSFNVQEYLLERLSHALPEDAHLRVNGKLHISLTRVYDGKNVIVSQFTGKDDLVQALLASAFVPIFSGFLPPKFHGERYMDGGFSDNLPTLDENTITVSPFCGESDICPRDFSSQLFHVNFSNTSIELSKQNIYRFARILWPPKPEVLSNLCKQGFDDALRFLHQNNLINCTKCLSVQSTFIISEAVDDVTEYDPQCEECQMHRQEALVANLPDTVMRVFQDAIDSANKGFYNWMLSHRGMKLITILSLPYTIPIDFTFAILRKVKSLLIYMKNDLKQMCSFVIDQLLHSLYSIGSKARDRIATNVNCQLEYSGFGYDNEHIYEKELNFNIKVSVDESDFEKSTKIITDNIISRRSSLAFKAEPSVPADDTFENILQVTSHHDSVMAFYYMDDYNKVKVTEIFDVTDSSDFKPSDEIGDYIGDIVVPGTSKKGELKSLADDSSITDTYVDEDGSEGGNIFSDPESEWVTDRPKEVKVRRVSMLTHLRPECEQSIAESSEC